MTDVSVHGYNDWAWGHNRLHGGGITLNYNIPINEIKAKDPNASFRLRSQYFGGWGTEAEYGVGTYVNDKWVETVNVPGEHKGRTNRDVSID